MDVRQFQHVGPNARQLTCPQRVNVKCPIRLTLNGHEPERFHFDDHSSIRFVQKVVHVLPHMIDIKLVKVDGLGEVFRMG